MKTTDKTSSIDNPWAEGMKGSRDTSWLGRLWRGIAGASFAAAKVANASEQERSTPDANALSDVYGYCSDPYSQENINNPAFHDFRKERG